MENTRVAVFIDGANLFFLQNKDLQWSIDLRKLLSYIGTYYGKVVDAYYYIGLEATPDTGMQGFLNALPKMGYALRTKPIKIVGGKRKGNLDVEIVLDMFSTIDLYDTAVLVSGDGDFDRALQLLRAKGKRFKVLSTEGFVAHELRNTAGMHYIDLANLRAELEKTSQSNIEDAKLAKKFADELI